MEIIRVFPRKTKATPDDSMVRFGLPTMYDAADEIHVSVTFTYDTGTALNLAKQWENVAPVKIGGPALGQKSGHFEPGKYLKYGYTITSRGCPNKCWFCSAWKREGSIRELEIKDGWNVLDDNLLACSEQHIRNVFNMLKRQPKPIEFTGGFEANRFKEWHVDLLLGIRLKQVFFAYDTKDDLEPLINASRILTGAGLVKPTSHKIRCYVLIGYPNDTIDTARIRLETVTKLGLMPMAMLWRNKTGVYEKEWKRFQREWANPIILGSKTKRLYEHI